MVALRQVGAHLFICFVGIDDVVDGEYHRGNVPKPFRLDRHGCCMACVEACC